MTARVPIPERELAEMLDARHVRYLTEFEIRVLAATVYGYGVADIATGLGCGESTVRRHLADLKHRVFDLLGMD